MVRLLGIRLHPATLAVSAVGVIWLGTYTGAEWKAGSVQKAVRLLVVPPPLFAFPFLFFGRKTDPESFHL